MSENEKAPSIIPLELVLNEVRLLRDSEFTPSIESLYQQQCQLAARLENVEGSLDEIENVLQHIIELIHAT